MQKFAKNYAHKIILESRGSKIGKE